MATETTPQLDATQTATAVRLQGVSVRLGDRLALDNVSVGIEAGTFVGLIGPNGSGKSTMLRAILGVVPLASGEVTIGGLDPNRARDRFAYLPQRRQIDLDVPVRAWDVVMMGRIRHTGWLRPVRREDRETAEWALNLVGLLHRRNSNIGEMSFGQQQRVFFARALAQRGDILLLDEPMNGVDPQTQELFIELLRGFHREGKTIVMATHDLTQAAAMCDNLCVLNQHLVGYGTVEDVLTEDVLREAYGIHLHFAPGRAPAGPPPRRHPSPRRGAALMLDWLLDPLDFRFMQLALIEVVIVGAVAGFLGTYVVTRGMAFVGDAITHAVFPGIVIAFLANVSLVIGAAGFGVLTAMAISSLSLTRRIREDTAIGVVFAAFFALGVVLISTTEGYTRDLTNILFGDILAVTNGDIYLSIVVGGIALALGIGLRRALVLASFDREMAQSLGLPVFWLDTVLLLLITMTIVISLRAVGNILVLAMFVTPAATARLLVDDVGRMMPLGAALGAAAGVVGLYISWHTDLAAGGMIVLTATGFFIAALLFSLLRSRLLPRPDAV